ncbi:MAG: hypothetical protein IJA69_05915 [Clostridia bacterium]|nr:hypothetical protein [Clostridia bacterium]
MSRRKNFSYGVSSLKYSFIDFLRGNRLKIYICSFFLLLGLLTGIFTAIKNSSVDVGDFIDAFGLSDSIGEIEKFSENFFGRLFSCELVAVLLLLFSQLKALNVFGYCMVAYRAFLVAINCVVLIFIYSFGGILKSLLIIFPCQLLMLVILAVYFCFSCHNSFERRCYGDRGLKKVVMPFVWVSVALCLVNLVETMLLFLFKSSVILVI